MVSIQSSPCFSLLMAEEMTDNTAWKPLAAFARYMKDGIARYMKNGRSTVSFVKNVQIPNGTADIIFAGILSIVIDCGGFHKMWGFGCNGVSIMTMKIMS